MLEKVTRRLLEAEVMEGKELRAILGVPEAVASDATTPLPQVPPPSSSVH
jgi:hypothetical protein